MEFTFQTTLDHKAITAMVKAIRKTVGKRKNRREQVLRWVILLLAILLAFFSNSFDTRTVLLLLVALFMIAMIFFEDNILAFASKKRMLPGAELENSRLSDASFITATSVGSTEFQYDRIIAMAESKDYFFVLYSERHALIFNKQSLTGGTLDEFRSFIRAKTGLEFAQI